MERRLKRVWYAHGVPDDNGSFFFSFALRKRKRNAQPKCDAHSKCDSAKKKESSGYEVDVEIGKGGFASVYKGYKRHTQEKVAIKVIQKANYRDFPREIEIHSSLNHKFIVPLLDHFQDGMIMKVSHGLSHLQ